MHRTRKVAALAGALTLVLYLACRPDSTRATGPRAEGLHTSQVPTDDPPPEPFVVNGACEEIGDFSADVVFLPDLVPGACALAATGFNDQAGQISFEDHVAFPTTYPQHVFWVDEVRRTTSGAGRRSADSGFINASTLTYTANLTVHLIRELQGISMVGWVGGCPTGLNLGACVQYARAGVGNTTKHDEPRLCIWNPTVGAAGSLATWCSLAARDSDKVATNRLPTASSFITILPLLPGELQLAARCVVDGSSSSDPEAAALTLAWFYPGLSLPYYGATQGLILSNNNDPNFAMRLRVADPLGGMDVTYLPTPNCSIAFAF
jgi:hypothetical protein